MVFVFFVELVATYRMPFTACRYPFLVFEFSGGGGGHVAREIAIMPEPRGSGNSNYATWHIIEISTVP